MPQDFSGHNLRGRSFKGQNLEGANFSGADIRSADFTGANLRNANFSHATAGLQKRWTIFLVCVSCLLSGVSGFFSALIGVLIALIFNSNSTSQVVGWTTLIIIIVLFIVIIHQGLNSAFALAGAFAFAFAFAGALAGAGAGAGAGALAVAVALAFAVAFAVARAFAFAFAGVLLSIYIAWQAMKGDEKYSLVRNITIALAATGGTSFRGADLTNADFTQATLKSTDLRNTVLTATCWHQAKMFDRVRPWFSLPSKRKSTSTTGYRTGTGQKL